MITNNYWYLFSNTQNGTDVSGFVGTGNETGWWFPSTASYDSNRSLTTNISPQFGVTDRSGTLPSMNPTDYTVASGYTHGSQVTYDTITGIIVPEAGLGLKRIYTITGREITGGTRYIRRVGLVKTFTGCKYDYLTRDVPVLLAEIDLDQPIILNPYDAFSITLCWNQG